MRENFFFSIHLFNFLPSNDLCPINNREVLANEYIFDIADKVTEFRSIIFVVGENDLTEEVRRDFYANLGTRRDITTDDN